MTQSNDSDSVSLTLSVQELDRIHHLTVGLDSKDLITISQSQASGIGTATKVKYITEVDVTDYETW